MTGASPRAEVAVGAIALRDGELLLVRRARDPAAGRWSVPGGRVRFGETCAEAVVREVREETGLDVLVEGFAGWVERMGDDPGRYHFVILDFFVRVLDPAPDPRPGDDALDARWIPIDDVDGLPLVDGLAEFLLDVGALPAV